MPRQSDNRDRILGTAYQLFYERGFSRISMDAVAARAGITKRTLYNHFDSKDRLFGEMLKRQSTLAVARIKTWATQQGGSAEDFVATIFERLAAWSAKKRWEGSGFTRLALELADLPGHPGRTAARRHKAMIERVFADELRRRGLKRPEEAARALQILTEGATILTLIHGDSAYVGTAAEAARAVLKGN
ncbi:TetR/AcrR family transcriptional regulator [Dongia sp.]|uniref:TetR/AcrR family transcriptional regulator n=1 Tax=Dongia sp. TaxID=1977262 RepID=UPI0037532B5E